MSEAETGNAHASEGGRGSRLWRLVGALSLSGTASLLFLPHLSSPAGPTAEGARHVASYPPVGESSAADMIASYPPFQAALLTGNAWAMASTRYGQPPAMAVPSIGIWRDPTTPLGYRFRTADWLVGTDSLPLPEGLIVLIVPDPDVAALLDPSAFSVEHVKAEAGEQMSVARVREGSVLALRAHGDHPHITQRARDGPPVADSSMARIRVSSAHANGQITGPESPNDTGTRWDVYGTDLGSVFWHRDRLYMTFGDAFGEGSRWEGRNWRSNGMARLATPGPRPEVLRIESMVSGAHGFAREILPSRKIDGLEMTVLPTSGVSTGDRMFVHYKSVKEWIVSGEWVVGHSGIAYSDDGGETWLRPPAATWPGGIGFEQAALVRSGGWIYSFGIPGGRYGPVRLRRVPEERILEAHAYEYWDGAGWISDPERATPIVPAPVGQLSVAWNPHYGVWMMMYLKPSVDAVVLRLAPQLTGPWGDWQFVVRGEEHPGLYAPYIVPLPDTGEEVWFTMSKWWPYNIFLMRMTLETVPLTVERR